MKAVLLVENGDGTTTTLHLDAADVVVSQQYPGGSTATYNDPRALPSAAFPYTVEVTVKSARSIAIVNGGIPENVYVDDDARDYVLTHMPVGQEITAGDLRRLLATAYTDGKIAAAITAPNRAFPKVTTADLIQAVEGPLRKIQQERQAQYQAMLQAPSSESILQTIQNEMQQQQIATTIDAVVAANLRAQLLEGGYAVTKNPPIGWSAT